MQSPTAMAVSPSPMCLPDNTSCKFGVNTPYPRRCNPNPVPLLSQTQTTRLAKFACKLAWKTLPRIRTNTAAITTVRRLQIQPIANDLPEKSGSVVNVNRNSYLRTFCEANNADLLASPTVNSSYNVASCSKAQCDSTAK